MAEIENPFSKNFSIENTMETGLGNAELLNDLYESESVTGDADDVEKIIKEVDKDIIPEKKPAKGKEIPGDEAKDEAPSGQSLITDFLSQDDEEQEEEPSGEELVPEEPAEQKDVSQFTALANDLFKLGVFVKEEDEEDVTISSPEEFLERFNAEKGKGARQMVDNFIGQFGQDYQDAFQAIYVKGVDPKDYFGIYNNIVSFTELDLTVEENQIAVMKQALNDQGFEPEDITTEIERLKNYGDLESVSLKHHKVLVKKEAQKLQQVQADAERELQQKSAVKGQWIQNVQNVLQEKLKTKEFDGIPLNSKLANELQDFLLVDKYKTGNGELLTDFDKTVLELKRPENHAMKVKVALLIKLLEKDPTLATIQRSGMSKKSDVLFDELARQKTKARTSAPIQGKPSSWFQ